MGRQHQAMDRPGVRQVPEGSGEQGKMDETGCEIICGAPTTHAVMGQMRRDGKNNPKEKQLIKSHLYPLLLYVNFWR